MKFWYNNFIAGSGVTITASSEVSTLPVENILHDHLAKVWKTGASSATETVVFDFGSAVSPQKLIMASTNGNVISQGAVQANTSDSWGSPAYQSSAGIFNTSGALRLAITGQTYRYWRVIISKDNSSDQAEIGNIFLGTAYDLDSVIEYDGMEESFRDTGRTYISRGGQTFSDAGENFRRIKLSASNVSEDKLYYLHYYIIRTFGQHTPLWVEIDEYDSTTALPGGIVYAKMDEPITRSNPSYDGSSFYWDLSISLREEK